MGTYFHQYLILNCYFKVNILTGKGVQVIYHMKAAEINLSAPDSAVIIYDIVVILIAFSIYLGKFLVA